MKNVHVRPHHVPCVCDICFHLVLKVCVWGVIAVVACGIDLIWQLRKS